MNHSFLDCFQFACDEDIRPGSYARPGAQKNAALLDRGWNLGTPNSLVPQPAMGLCAMLDRGFESDAAYFDIVARQAADPADRRHLREVAKTYRSLSRNGDPQHVARSRKEHWEKRAEECRTLADQFRNPTCRAQLRRLAETYDMMVAHCVAGKDW